MKKLLTWLLFGVFLFLLWCCLNSCTVSQYKQTQRQYNSEYYQRHITKAEYDKLMQELEDLKKQGLK